ncbi:hypothetical protein [Brevibacterium spongiae]|uniref:Uncharacterized protein n=1 Tax=Brevibacterium spongiae TaxID=2909672 RepID=A0ABY5SR13_9MICO|nr:hypothetical protein [Brevibacterium spongiae]UVI36992.1 hypothetical protein L1F31_04880 [Brevibacterium spongiae]
MAIGIIDDNTTQLVIAGVGLSWIVPALVVYLIKALAWSRRSTALLLTWLGVLIAAFVAGVMADSFAPSGPVPFIAAGLLWVAAPIFSLLALRR